MKNIAIFSLFIFSFGLVANADYSVYTYDPSYTPYNLQAAIDHGNCEDELDEFDSKYQEIRQRYIEYQDGTWAGSSGGQGFYQGNQASINELNEIETAFQLNDLESENAIAECLESTPTKAEEDASRERQQAREDAREEEIMMAIAACDHTVLEDLDEEEEERFGERAAPCLAEREKEILAAVQVCDFDFFENQMTRNERNDWFSERKECEENPPAPEPVEVVQVSEPVTEPVVTEPVMPTYVPPEPTEQVTLDTTPEPQQESELEVIEEDVATSTQPTTTNETIELTQEELDQIVEDRLNEKLEEQSEPESQPEEKPSFFKRVTNFLFGWMF